MLNIKMSSRGGPVFPFSLPGGSGSPPCPLFSYATAGDVRSYWPSSDILHTADGIVFDSDRILILASLRSHMLNLIHESHLGME